MSAPWGAGEASIKIKVRALDIIRISLRYIIGAQHCISSARSAVYHRRAALYIIGTQCCISSVRSTVYHQCAVLYIIGVQHCISSARSAVYHRCVALYIISTQCCISSARSAVYHHASACISQRAGDLKESEICTACKSAFFLCFVRKYIKKREIHLQFYYIYDIILPTRYIFTRVGVHRARVVTLL